MNKLLFGKGLSGTVLRQPTLKERWSNVLAIWHNTYEEDAGLEKIVRLILALSQFLFPGVYIRHLFWRSGPLVQDLAIEIYVLFKALLPALVLWAGGWSTEGVLWLVGWLMVETLLYIPTMIFASDALPSPRSYRRSKLLVFINYLEVVLTFAVLHMHGQYFNAPLSNWTDAVYLSFVITSTIGFGEFYPITDMGKLVVSIQSLFYLSYIALFMSVFNTRATRGYFEGSDK
ncbi:MAG: two pore domain potassium channel family protein [Flavobacteriales bacterium]|nr:two pore domain potassium channel family protein [Flavobacteriales bacterium]MBK9514702.1 two pore domain potassium channel family protein [Flavobacteriales bacterium]MBP7450814.1 two pore domain potassium channel family protein [Flavobacteriales bacterium]